MTQAKPANQPKRMGLRGWWWTVWMAVYIAQLEETSYRDAWRTAHKWWWQQYREWGMSPREAILETYLQNHG